MPEAAILSLTRRAAFRLAAAAPLALLAACRRASDSAPRTTVPLAALPEGRRVRLLRGEEPVEVVRTGSEIRARSLWCTHLGCEVTWNETDSTYDCPCHDGRFDSAGQVLAGPPTQGLRVVPTRVVGGQLVLLAPDLEHNPRGGTR